MSYIRTILSVGFSQIDMVTPRCLARLDLRQQHGRMDVDVTGNI